VITSSNPPVLSMVPRQANGVFQEGVANYVNYKIMRAPKLDQKGFYIYGGKGCRFLLLPALFTQLLPELVRPGHLGSDESTYAHGMKYYSVVTPLENSIEGNSTLLNRLRSYTCSAHIVGFVAFFYVCPVEAPADMVLALNQEPIAMPDLAHFCWVSRPNDPKQ
jgi:hypothetical protein